MQHGVASCQRTSAVVRDALPVVTMAKEGPRSIPGRASQASSKTRHSCLRLCVRPPLSPPACSLPQRYRSVFIEDEDEETLEGVEGQEEEGQQAEGQQVGNAPIGRAAGQGTGAGAWARAMGRGAEQWGNGRAGSGAGIGAGVGAGVGAGAGAGPMGRDAEQWGRGRDGSKGEGSGIAAGTAMGSCFLPGCQRCMCRGARPHGSVGGVAEGLVRRGGWERHPSWEAGMRHAMS